MLPVALLPERLEDLERHFGVRRALHVDADEEARRRPLENPAQVVDRAGAVDVEAELGELQREVAADAGLDDRVDDAQVIARRGVGFGERR